MNTINIISVLLTPIQLLFIIRFHLETSKLDGFMEPANTIRKITNPFVLPIKRFIPGNSFKKIAAIISVILIDMFIVIALFFIYDEWQFSSVNIVLLIIMVLFYLLSIWLKFLLYGMFLFVICSWIQISALQKVNYLLHNLFDPILYPIRRFIPAIGGLDFSPIIVILFLSFVENLLNNSFRYLFY